MTQNVLNEVKHRKVDLEQFLKEKVVLEEKIDEDTSEEDTQRLLECIGMIARHKRESKEFEDWLSEKSTLPIKFEKVSDVSSVKLKADVMSPVPLSFFSSVGIGMVSIGFLSLPSVGVEAVRLVEPVVEEVKVSEQLLADANKLMADAVSKV